MASSEVDGSDDLQRWLQTFELDKESYTCIFETLKPNQFSARLKIMLTGPEELVMCQKQLSLGAKALLHYQISLLKEQSPLQKTMPSRRCVQSLLTYTNIP